MNKIIIAVIFSITWTGPSFAYVDPGTGSALLSVLIGFLVAISVIIKSFWFKIKKIFGFSQASSLTRERNESDQK